MASEIASHKTPAQMVVGLARGGIVVAHPIAEHFGIPLEILVVKKIPSPYNPELAIGALAPDGVSLVYWRNAHREGADEAYIRGETQRLSSLIKEKTLQYRRGRKPISPHGKDVVVVDDGAATGATLETAVAWLKTKKAKHIIVALPVAPPEVIAKITPEVFKVIVMHTPQDMGSVGEFYDAFPQVDDREVIELLA